jgi:hypothetical protein
MNTYTVYFRNDQQCGYRDIDADTPQRALELARCVATENREVLNFTAYDRDDYINEIEVCDSEDNSVAVWHDDHLRVCLAAPDLQEALEAVCDLPADDTGDRTIPAGFLDQARAAIAKAKGGAA